MKILVRSQKFSHFRPTSDKVFEGHWYDSCNNAKIDTVDVYELLKFETASSPESSVETKPRLPLQPPRVRSPGARQPDRQTDRRHGHISSTAPTLDQRGHSDPGSEAYLRNVWFPMPPQQHHLRNIFGGAVTMVTRHGRWSLGKGRRRQRHNVTCVNGTPIWEPVAMTHWDLDVGYVR